MKRRRILLILTTLSMALLLGCQTGAPRPSPGMSSLHVKVIAEPKAGVFAPDDRSSTYDIGGGGRDLGRGDFELVDYAALGDIVVWAEPSAASSAPAPVAAALDVDAARPAAGIARAVSVGQRLTVHNRGARPANFYSVSDGNDFDAGVVSPGGSAEYVIRSPGLIEILTDSAKDPIAQIYAAPTRWVALGRSGGAVDFTDLPPGPCKILSWHPRLPGHETALTLAPDQSASTSIKVGVNGLPTIGRRPRK